MSKHLKQVRRERKKTDRARRTRAMSSSSPNSAFRIPKAAAAALATAAAIAAGTSAYASPVRFDNPARGEAGHFEWVVPTPSSSGLIRLDIALPADQQDSVSWTATAIRQSVENNLGKMIAGHNTFPGTELQTKTLSGVPNFIYAVDSGVSIPTAGASWNGFQTYSWLNPAYVGTEGWFAEGEQAYMGVRFDLGAGTQYGWIGVSLEPAGAGVVRGLDAFAWGYETEVGVPLAAGVPEPGTLALLAVGAVGLAGRRSRRQRHDN